MTTRALRATLVCGVALMMGCSSLEDNAKHLKGPDALQWDGNARFQVAGNRKMWGQAQLLDGKIRFFVHQFPPGTVLRVGEESATVDKKGMANLTAGVTALLGSVALHELEPASLKGATVSIVVPGASTIEVPLPPLKTYGVKDLLHRVGEAPLVFVGESKGPSAIRNVIWFHSVRHDVFGAQASSLRDIDSVAVATRSEGTVKMCTGYKDEKGGPAADLRLRLRDTEIKVYERRTGRVVATQRFAPVDTCPKFVTVKGKGQAERDSELPTDAIKTWLSTKVLTS